MMFNHYLIIIGTAFILITLFYIIHSTLKWDVPYSLKHFYVFPLVGFIISCNSIMWTFLHLYNKSLFNIIQETLNLLAFISIYLFFFKVFEKKKNLNFLKTISFILIIIYIIVSIINYNKNINFPVYTILTFSIIPYCLIYYFTILNVKPTIILFKNSSFWIVTGILIHTSIGSTIYNLYHFVPKSGSTIGLRSFLFSFVNISAIIFYILIIKAYSCLKHPQNS